MEFPNGARVVIAHEGSEDSDPDNYVFLSPYVREVDGGYEITNIHSEGPPLVIPVESEYESDELTPDFAWVDDMNTRVMCFQPTEQAQWLIEQWRSENT